MFKIRKISFFILVFVKATLLCSGQDTKEYYYSANGKATDMVNAVRKVVVEWDSERRAGITGYRKTGDNSWEMYSQEKVRIKSEQKHIVISYRQNSVNQSTIRTFNYKGDGIFGFQDFRDGQIVRYGKTRGKIPLHLEGEVIEFYPNGNKKSESYYSYNQLIWNQNWLEDGDRYIDSIFYSVDHWPEYQSGVNELKRYINASIRTSRSFSEELSGRVMIGFVIMKDGTLQGVRILEGRNMGISEDIAQAFSELPGSWEPGILDLKPVRCFMVFPVNFLKETGRFEYIHMEGGILFYNYR